VKVLLVDDNAAMRRVIATVLVSIAATVVECADGDEAVRAYEAHRPDVVVMDLVMARVNGIAATAAIVAADPAARVVMLTNHADDALRGAAARAGACGYLLKDDLTALPALLTALPGLPQR
jgi:DNA-binding NarL/FixJ family response regulator